MLDREFNPGRKAQDHTRYQWTNRVIHYRPRIKSQKTAQSVVGVESTTFRTAVIDDDKDYSASTETVTTATGHRSLYNADVVQVHLRL